MKLFALAVDYDGTIAINDVVDPSTREAIAQLREQGVVVVLATGRILTELQRVAGDLRFVDAVIAENGAVVHFPESGQTAPLAPRMPAIFTDELTRLAIIHRPGLSLVDASSDDAPALLEVIRRLELPLVLIFNKGRVMVMPQGISKGTGLHMVLDMLRLSPRNTAAIGDAENDHELLRLAEVGIAVPWASSALRAAADVVLTGNGRDAVDAAIHDLARSRTLPAVQRARRRLLAGYTEDGREFWLDARGRNVLIAGDTKSGKSWIAGLLCEQMILHGYCVCVLDPEGDYRSLEALPGVAVVGGDEPPPSPRQLMRALRYPDRSVVVDLSRLPQNEKVDYIRAALPALNVLRQHVGLPHRIVIDEAHYFLHGEEAARLLDLDRNGYTVVTYCASRLPAALLRATEVILVTCESNPAEVAALRGLNESGAASAPHEWNRLGLLRPAQAVALPMTAEAEGQLRVFTVARRLTPHVRHREKYVDVPVSDAHAFVITSHGMPARRLRTLRELVTYLEHATPSAIAPFLKRGDFSRWIKEVFGDHALAAELQLIETQPLGVETIPEMVDAVRSRYDLVDELPEARAS